MFLKTCKCLWQRPCSISCTIYFNVHLIWNFITDFVSLSVCLCAWQLDYRFLYVLFLCSCDLREHNATQVSVNNGVVCDSKWLSKRDCLQYTTCTECLAKWPTHISEMQVTLFLPLKLHVLSLLVCFEVGIWWCYIACLWYKITAFRHKHYSVLDSDM